MMWLREGTAVQPAAAAAAAAAHTLADALYDDAPLSGRRAVGVRVMHLGQRAFGQRAFVGRHGSRVLVCSCLEGGGREEGVGGGGAVVLFLWFESVIFRGLCTGLVNDALSETRHTRGFCRRPSF